METNFEKKYALDNDGKLVFFNNHPQMVIRLGEIKMLLASIEGSFPETEKFINTIEQVLFHESGTHFGEWTEGNRTVLTQKLRRLSELKRTKQDSAENNAKKMKFIKEMKDFLSAFKR